MRSRGLPALLMLLLLVTASGALAAPAPLPEPARLIAMRARPGPRTVRLEIDFSGARPPLWQVSCAPDEPTISIDLKNVDASGASPPSFAGDRLVQDWSVTRPTFLSACATVRLKQRLPASCVHARMSGDTLVVEIDRDFSSEQTLALTRNVTWRRTEMRVDGDYCLINALELVCDADVKLRVAHAGDTLTQVEDPVALAQRKHALAFVNGGFFRYTGGPLGLVIDEGRVLVPHVSHRPPRTAVGFKADGTVLMNRIEVVGANPRAIDGSADWSKVLWALGAGPRLVRDGRVALTTDEEGLGRSGNDITRKAGRTAVARLRDGRLLLVTISGYRDNHAQGWSLSRLAAWLVEQGAVDAMNLDGGGSVAMVIDGVLVSRPPARQGRQRRIANGLMVTDASPLTMPATVRVTAPRTRMEADGVSTIRVVAAVTNAAGKPVADGTLVRFTASGGTITASAPTRKGRATAIYTAPRALGPATITAAAGLASGQTTVTMEGGAPRSLAASVEVMKPLDGAPSAIPSPDDKGDDEGPGPVPTPVATSSRVGSIQLLVLDPYGNALPGQEVFIVQADGARTRVLTGTDGVGRLTMPLGNDVQRLRATCGALVPISIAIPREAP